MDRQYSDKERALLSELALEAEEELVSAGWFEAYDFDGIFGRQFGPVQVLTIGHWAEYHTCVYAYPEHEVDRQLLRYERSFIGKLVLIKGKSQLRNALKEIIKFRLLLRIHGKAETELDFDFTPRLGFGPSAPSTMNVVKDNIPLRLEH